jgi:hypothetical protein
MAMDLEELIKKTKAAMDAAEELELEREGWVRERVAKVNAEADAIYKDRLTVLKNNSFLLQQELRKANDQRRVEESIEALPYPEGTIVIRDPKVPLSFNWWSKTVDRMERGVIQVFRPGDPERENQSRHHCQPVGMIIVRIITRDGKQGKIYVPWSQTKQYWIPAPK